MRLASTLMPASRQLGVTLIEMMVAIAVLAILLAVAVPSFNDFRQRSAVRGAAEQLMAVLADARFEAVKRNSTVTVNFQKSGSAWCTGAITGTTACDCFQKNPAGSGYCTVALYPPLDNSLTSTAAAQATVVLKGVVMNTDPSSAMGGDSSVTIDPLTGALSSLSDGGSLELQSQTAVYKLQFSINGLGRGNLCKPANSRSVIGYSAC